MLGAVPVVAAWVAAVASTAAAADPPTRTTEARDATPVPPARPPAGEPRNFGAAGRYRFVPAGNGVQGCAPNSPGCRPDASPERAVALTRAYWMKETEVTQREWRRIMGRRPRPWFARCGDDCPMESVSRSDAYRYLDRLSRRAGLQPCYAGRARAAADCNGYRLPTEAEWEYAARAGGAGVTYGPRDEIAWWWHNNGGSPRPVGTKRPNPWGLYDVLGNVWEWCEDTYAVDAYGEHPARDPPGPPGAGRGVMRGSLWSFGNPVYLHAAFRWRIAPDERYFFGGFRPVRSFRPEVRRGASRARALTGAAPGAMPADGGVPGTPPSRR